MIGIVLRLTLRQLRGRGRTLMMGLLALLPIVVAVVYRLGSQDTDQQEWAATVLFEGLIVTTLLPLAAVVYGTAVLGSEIEDGTAVYLLAKPVSRARIVAAKLLASWLATTVTVLGSGLVAGAIALAGAPEDGILLGFGVAIVLGSLVYSALFLMLSVVTSRALIIGLVYVFLWEGLVNGLFAGTRLLSVRHYTLGVADLFVDAPASDFEARLGAVTALVLMAVVGAGTAWYAVRRLGRFEIGEST
ncbi:MAG TPA: ABC transporter permease [Gaiellaceae bacterium]|nr:ABC transporter permease [Gaiellaceae bacterium]